MLVFFQNVSSQKIAIGIANQIHTILSNQKISLDVAANQVVDLQVVPSKNVSKKNGTYRLLVGTEYILEGLDEGSIITLTRERISIDLNTSYDRVFLHPSVGEIVEERYRIVNHPQASKQYRKDTMMNTAIWEPLVEFLFEYLWNLIFHPIRTLLCIGVAIGLGIKFGWYWILIILLGGLLLYSFINIVVDPLIEKFVSKLTGVPTEKETLLQHCTSEAIAAYYSQPERQPFGSKPIEK